MLQCSPHRFPFAAKGKSRYNHLSQWLVGPTQLGPGVTILD